MRKYPVDVQRVVDGDTLDLCVQFEPFPIKFYPRVRLLGVDTAETYGVSTESAEYQAGKEQAESVCGWLEEAESLTATFDGQGKYGRWLADLQNEDGESLVAFLIERFDVAVE